MKRTTKVIAVFTAILLILSAIPITAYAASWNISVKVNNKAIAFPDQKPVIQNERTLVPIRFVAEALGYDVEWNKTDNSAVIDGGKIILQKAVEIKEGDTPEVLQRRIMEEAEWKLLPEAVSLFCQGRIHVEGRNVIVKEK